VQYRLHIQRRSDVRVAWAQAPRFPALRAEWLPPRAAAPAAAPPGFLLEEERRALFAARAGELEIPAASLRCEAGDQAEVVRVPAARLRALPVPPGAPPGWSGLVGPVRVQLRADPRRLALGAAVRLSLQISGAANVWDARPALRDALAPELGDLFPGATELTRDAGRRLVFHQHLSWSLVPRKPGLLEIPPLTLPWLDPERGSWRASSTPPLEIRVDPARAAAAGHPPAGPASSSPAPPGRSDAGIPHRSWIAAALFLGLLGLLGMGTLLWQRRWHARRPSPPALEPHWGRARAAAAQGDSGRAAAALARALRAALEPHRPGAGALSAEEILGHCPAEGPARELARLLQCVEQRRFAARPSAETLDRLLQEAQEPLARAGAPADR